MKRRLQISVHIQKMRIDIKYSIIVFLVMFMAMQSGNSLFAQNQEVTIIAPYKPTISDAFKKPLNPVLKDTVIETPPINYGITSHPIFTAYDITSLKPSLIDVDTEEVMHRNYLKAGFGNYVMPYVELFTNSLSSDDFSLGFHARHLSSTGKIEDYANSAFSQNNVSLFAKRYLKEKIVSGKVYYDRDVVHYYGYQPSDYLNDTLSDEQLRQRFSLIGVNLGLASNYRRNNKLNYKMGLNFYHLSDLYQSNEMKIGFDANVNSKKDSFDFADGQELGADLSVDYYTNQDSLLSQGTVVAEIKPYLRLNLEYLDLLIGVTGALTSDSATDFYVYPEIRASYRVIPDYLRFYVSVTGGLHRNSYRNVSQENPWVNSLFPLGFTNTKYDIKGGVTGKINLAFDYNFSVSYADVENMLFFNNDFVSAYSPEFSINFGNKFTGIYDDAKVTTIGLELGYQQSQLFSVLLKANYREYQLATQAKPWHKPATEVVLTGKYNITDEITLGGDLFFNSQTYAQVLDADALKIEENKAYVDLNLSAEYRFSDRVSAFARINNVTSTRYFRWYNYPSQRINAMLGFTFSF